MPRYVVDLVLDQLVSLDVRKKISPGRRARHASSASVAPRTNPMSRWPSKSAHWIRPSRHTLAEVVGMAFSAVTSGDVCGFFEHRGYRMAVELSLPQLALVVAKVDIRASSGAGAVHHQESVALAQRSWGPTSLGPTTSTAMHGQRSEDLPRWSIAYENRCGHCTCTRL